MRGLCLFAGIFLLLNATSSSADRPSFPYEAIVDVEDGESVWSGPDYKKHYPTSQLNKGDRVKVYRHDPGGWCMIAPPKGSFSWVRDLYIRQDTQNTGIITANRVVVHVGSELNPDEFTTIQAEVSKGDAVEILGTKSFSIPGEEIRNMVKISSPKGEWRWIPRKSIVPVDSNRNSPFPDEPLPGKRKGPIAGKDDSNARRVSSDNKLNDEATEGTLRDLKTRTDDSPDLGAGKQKLAEIDKQFRDMVRQDPPTWDLDSLEEQYKNLDAELDQPAMTAEIGRRLDSIKRHRKVHADYADFFKILSETKERDGQLALAQPNSQQPSADGLNSVPINQKDAPTGTQPQSGKVPSFDGAGIVQRVANPVPGGPQYVLIAPDGRILSLLQPSPGVDLSRWNNREMGIIGQRFHRDDWNVDVINVRSLQPVRLNKNK